MFHAWKVLSMSVHLYLYIFSIARWTIWKCQLLNDPSGEMMETYKQQSYCTRQPLRMFPRKNTTDTEVLRSFGTRLAKLSFFFFGLMIRSVWHRPSWNDVSRGHGYQKKIILGSKTMTFYLKFRLKSFFRTMFGDHSVSCSSCFGHARAPFVRQVSSDWCKWRWFLVYRLHSVGICGPWVDGILGFSWSKGPGKRYHLECWTSDPCTEIAECWLSSGGAPSTRPRGESRKREIHFAEKEVFGSPTTSS